MTTIEGGYDSVSAFSSSSDIEEAQRQIYEEIKSLEESIRALKSRHNTLVVISRLPPEILAKIFKFVAATDLENLSWVRVSHVCSHWRAVALECPGLWSFIPLLRPRWAEEMLKRSKMSPLVVVAKLNRSFLASTVASIQSALKEITRIQELHILGSTSTLLNKLLDGISGPAPLLESLCLSSNGNGGTLPEYIFMGETPRLRKLELLKCNIAWDSPLLSGITQLKIHSVSSGARPSMSQLLAALEKMPSLKTLDLINTLPSSSVDPAATPLADRVVDLPCLSYVHISSETLSCARLLDHLSYPVTATIKFLCKTTANSDISSFLSAISRTASTGVEPHLHSLSATYYSELNTVWFCAWDFPSDGDGIYMEGLDQARVHIELSLCRGSKVNTVLKALCKSLPLHELQVVRIVWSQNLPKNTWLAIFGRLQNLKYLLVSGYCGPGLLCALSTERAGVMHQSKSPENKPAALYFPKLRTLVIDEWYFGEVDKDETILETLSTCLMERCEHEAAIQELVITNSYYLDSNDIRLLEEIVVDVDWDEYDPDSEDDDEEDRFADGCPSCGCDPGDSDEDKFIDGCPDCGYDPDEEDSEDSYPIFS